MSKLADNEQAKLSANYLNGVAIALMTAGVLAPVVGSLATGTRLPVWGLAILVVGCMLLSGGLHFLARLVLRGLAE